MPASFRRPAFWLAVGVVSVLANTAAEVLADRIPSAGLRSLVAYSHRGKEA